MLKIKDNVDLKELESFGFIPEIYCGDRAYEKKYTKGFYKEYIIIWWKDREIKFRAYPKRWLKPEMLEVTSIFPRKKAVMCSCCRLKFDEIELMQSTGLKDKNGVEIYEGDIVHLWGGEYAQGFYEYDEKNAIENLIIDGFFIMEYLQTGNVEVIGNIYENPELLKECEE